MKLITYYCGNGENRLGVLCADGAAFDLLAAAEAAGLPEANTMFGSMLMLIEAGNTGLDTARSLLKDMPSSSYRETAGAYALRAPLPVPPQMRDFMAFEQHVLQGYEASIKMRASRAKNPTEEARRLRASGNFEVPKAWYKQPLYYKCNRFAVTDPEKEIVWPAYSKLMDYELELACIIGTGGKDIQKENARKHVFGFTVFNDLSARDAQAPEMQGSLGPAKAKDFDDANPMGPCIVTVDEIGDPYNLTMTATVNGEKRSTSNSNSIYHTFEAMIEHVSQSETLYPGEIFGSGTVGDGCGLEAMRFLEDGDVIELEIEKIGILRNKVSCSRKDSIPAPSRTLDTLKA